MLVVIGSWFRVVFAMVCEGRADTNKVRPYIFIAISGDFFSWLNWQHNFLFVVFQYSVSSKRQKEWQRHLKYLLP